MGSDTAKVKSAAKWSIICEVLAKVIAPITTIVLARLLSQEVFGIVASLTAITSMADMLADAGFNAYIVQHQFNSEKERKGTINICFWTNIVIAIILFAVIVFNREFFSQLVGAKGYGNVLAVVSLVIPMVSISSIEMAIMKKDLNFKSLGVIKIISKFLPFFVTIPLALWGYGYWSLVIGAVAGEFIGMFLSVLGGRYYPSLSYPIQYIKSIFSFSIWAYLESILEWLIANVAILVLATLYGMAALGVFKVAVNLVTQITTSVYALYSNVYKSAIAKEQNDDESFRKMFLTFQKYSSLLSLPLGVGVFMFRDLITTLLLGESWIGASTLIGLYCLTCTASISFGNFYSDGIRAKGHPFKLVVIDYIYLMSIILLLYSTKNIEFEVFCIIFGVLKILQPLMQAIVGRKVCNVSFTSVINNSYPQIAAAFFMAFFIYIFGMNHLQIIWELVFFFVSLVVYIVFVYLLSPDKKLYRSYMTSIPKRLIRKNN